MHRYRKHLERKIENICHVHSKIQIYDLNSRTDNIPLYIIYLRQPTVNSSIETNCLKYIRSLILQSDLLSLYL